MKFGKFKVKVGPCLVEFAFGFSGVFGFSDCDGKLEFLVVG